jgi:mono/diheme cytochrome c family protein
VLSGGEFKVQRKLIILLLLLSLVAVFAIGCGATEPTQPPANNDNEENDPGNGIALDGAALVEDRCAGCHNLDRVYREYDKERWPDIVSIMVQKQPGLLDDQEYERVVDYLQENYGK